MPLPLETPSQVKSNYKVGNEGASDNYSKTNKNTISFKSCWADNEEYGLTPRPTDVLLGRGRPFQVHPGNVRMKHIIEQYKDLYKSSARYLKTHITREVIRVVVDTETEGEVRFLKQQPLKENKSLMRWMEASDTDVFNKVSHGLRSMYSPTTKKSPVSIKAKKSLSTIGRKSTKDQPQQSISQLETNFNVIRSQDDQSSSTPSKPQMNEAFYPSCKSSPPSFTILSHAAKGSSKNTFEDEAHLIEPVAIGERFEDSLSVGTLPIDFFLDGPGNPPSPSIFDEVTLSHREGPISPVGLTIHCSGSTSV